MTIPAVRSDSDEAPGEAITLQLSIDPQVQKLVKHAFPETNKDPRQLEPFCSALATMMLEELCYFFAGQRRYLSLSHQYIEWMERIYFTLLPDQDYTYDRFVRQFGFPPGQAAYIARVLKDRQNVELEHRAANTLKIKLEQASAAHKALSPDDQVAQMEKRLTLSHREFKLLRFIVEMLLQNDEDIEDPQRISVYPSTIVASVHISYVDLILPVYDTIVEGGA